MSNTNLFLDRSIQVSAPKRTSSIRRSLGGKIVNPISLDAYILAWVTANPTTISGVLPVATTTVMGITELATDAEAIAGVSTTVVITPANLTAALATAGDLDSVLTNGNNTGTNDIEMADNQFIKAENGGGRLDLRNGGNNIVALTTDGGNFAEGWLYADTTSAQVGFSNSGLIEVAANNARMTNSSATGMTYMSFQQVGAAVQADEAVIVKAISVGTNGGGAVQFSSTGGNAVSINSGTSITPSTFNAAISNSAALGGIGITVKTDFTAYSNQLGLNASGSAFETLIDTVTLTADRTVEFPDASGKVALIRTVPTAVDHNALDGEIVLVSTGAGVITVTLPTPVGNDNMQITVKKVDLGAGTVSIATPAGTFDGAASPYSLLLPWNSVTLVSNSGNWLIIAII